jgi:hypothetical protein
MLGLALSRLRLASPLAARLMPEGSPLVPFMVVLHGGLILFCTLAGVILGLLLFALRDSGGGLGSPNLAFTLFIFGVTLALFAPVVVVIGRYRSQLVAAALAMFVLFGWLMPYMAQWSKFGSS